MPGMENTEPERMERSRGLLGIAEDLAGEFLERAEMGLDLVRESVRIRSLAGVIDTGLCGDDEAWRDGDAQTGHLRQIGAFATQ